MKPARLLEAELGEAPNCQTQQLYEYIHSSQWRVTDQFVAGL